MNHGNPSSEHVEQTDLRSRHKRILTSSVTGVVVSATFLAVGLAFRNVLIVAVCALLTVVCGAAVVLSRHPGNERLVGWLQLGSTWLGLFACAGLTGGLASPAAWFVLTLPVAAAQLYGWRAGRFWTAAAIVQLLLLLLAGLWGWTPPPPPSAGLLLTSALSALFVVAVAGFKVSTYEEQREVRDSELRESLAQLAAALERAEAASEAKSRFLANMSHEIRTPMNGVLGMTSLVLTDELTQLQRERIETVHRSGEVLLSILNEILDISRIESDQVVLEEVDFSLPQVVMDVVDLLRPRAGEKGLELTAELVPDLPRWVRGDPGRLRQVLLNLLGNAAKFTEEGWVRVSVAPAGPDRVRFEIADTGIGIRDDQVADLFRPFTQADASTTRRYGGTGLRLAISRGLVELAGGAIGARGRPEGGSVFWFELDLALGNPPLDTPAETPRALEPSAPQPRIRVLVVEDNQINQIVASSLLEQLGCSVGVASDGAQAVQAVQGERWDLVLMDCHMPTMDGFEATRRIRDREGDGERVRIIAMTAGASSGDRSACLDAGMDDFVSKPVSLSRLEQVVNPTAAAPRPER